MICFNQKHEALEIDNNSEDKSCFVIYLRPARALINLILTTQKHALRACNKRITLIGWR